jgi:transposase-like protein
VANAAGRLGGRPRKLTPEKAAAALAMRGRGDMTMSQIAHALGVGRSTLYDHLDLPRSTGFPASPPGSRSDDALLTGAQSAKLTGARNHPNGVPYSVP